MREREKVLEANIAYHRATAGVYDSEQPFIRNAYTQKYFVQDVEQLIANSGKPPETLRILDCGAGTGNLTMKFLSRGCNVTSVDLSEEMLGLLKKKAYPQYKNTFQSFVTDVDSFLISSNQQYDIICSSSFLHHLPDYGETYRLMAKCCGPEGQIYTAFEPKGASHMTWIEERYEWLDSALNYAIVRRLYNPVVLAPKVLRRIRGDKIVLSGAAAAVDHENVEDPSDRIDPELLQAIAAEEGFAGFWHRYRCVKRLWITDIVDRLFVRSNNALFAIASRLPAKSGG